MSKSIVGRSGLNGEVTVITFTSSVTTDNETDIYLVDATSGCITITLAPTACALARRIDIKKIDSSANTVTIDGNLAETIDGSLTQVLSTQYDSYTIITDGSNWFIL